MSFEQKVAEIVASAEALKLQAEKTRAAMDLERAGLEQERARLGALAESLTAREVKVKHREDNLYDVRAELARVKARLHDSDAEVAREQARTQAMKAERDAARQAERRAQDALAGAVARAQKAELAVIRLENHLRPVERAVQEAIAMDEMRKVGGDA
jgi:chromosome segregation ATPase